MSERSIQRLLSNERALHLWRQRCTRWLQTNQNEALRYFALVASLITLREECTFAVEEEAIVARYDCIPLLAISFYGDDPQAIRRLLACLIPKGTPAYALIHETQLRVLRRASKVEWNEEKWQMVFVGDADALSNTSLAEQLSEAALPEMQALAREVGVMTFREMAFRCGGYYGVWIEGHLAAMGGVLLRIPGFAEIGGICTHPAHRRKGYASAIVAALVREITLTGDRPLLHVSPKNIGAIRCYEQLHFAPVQTMCVVQFWVD